MSAHSTRTKGRREPAGPVVPTFVGRSAELGLVDEVLVRASGELQVVLVEGPVGIGKSRLLSELGARVERHGSGVLAGSATEFEQSLPFGLFFDAVGAVDWSGVGPEQDRFRFYREIRSAIEARTAASPTGAVLLLDDVQWADEGSLGLLEFLLRRPPRGLAGLVLAFRTGSCPHRLVRAMRGLEDRVTRIVVPPLPLAEIELLVPGLSAARRRALAQASAGNPLYLKLLKELPAQALPTAYDAVAGPDETVAGLLDETIRAELAAIDGDDGLVIRTAAVAGAEVDAELVAAAAELPVSRVSGPLDTLVARGLLLERRGRFRFAHPLLRAAAYHLSGPGERLIVHQRTAEHLSWLGAPLTIRAQHLQYVVRPGDADTADQLVRAARSALASAPASSAQWLTAVLDTLPDTDDARERRTELQLLLARALVTCGRLEQADAVLQPLLAWHGPDHRETVVLLAQCARLRGFSRQAYAMLEHVAADPQDPDSALILVELALIDLMNGRATRAAARMGSFFHTTEPQREAKTAAHVMVAFATAAQGRVAQALPGFEAAAHEVDAMGDEELRTILDHVVPILAWGLYMLEQHERALALLARAVKTARSCGHAYVLPHLYAVQACVFARQGLLAEALAAAEDAEETAAVFGAPDMAAIANALRMRVVLWMRGPGDACGLWEEGDRLPFPDSALFRLLAETMRIETALAAGVRSGPEQAKMLDADATWAAAPAMRGAYLALASYAALERGEIDGADERAELAVRDATATGLPGQLGRAHLARGNARAALGDPCSAAEAARTAAEYFASAGMPIEQGQALILAAEASAELGDADAADRQLAAARELYRSRNADWLDSNAVRAQRRIAARRPRRSAGTDGLSLREQQIAELIALGLTDQKIAERLFISPRTVQSHVGRILAKLGLSSRSGVARRLGRETVAVPRDNH